MAEMVGPAVPVQDEEIVLGPQWEYKAPSLQLAERSCRSLV